MPGALDGGRRTAHLGGDLLPCQVPEEPQLDDAGGIGPDLRELDERPVEVEDLSGREGNLEFLGGLAERNPGHTAAALLASVLAAVVHQDLPHYSGDEREEVGAVVGFQAAHLRHPQVRLVGERRWLERVVRALTMELSRSDGPKIVIEEPENLVGGACFTCFPLLQEARYFVGIIHELILLEGTGKTC